MKSILIVCLGNICRSPTAEAVLRHKVAESGLPVRVDSSGTGGYHMGESPDPRSMAAGQKRGYSFRGMRARQVSQSDFDDFDLILAADRQNLADLEAICPAHQAHKLALFLSYGQSSCDEIPDPYYGGPNGFETVLDLIEEASDGIIESLS